MEEKTQVPVQELFKQIDQVIADMEKEDVTLEDSFSLYKKGMDLLKECNQQIDHIEKQVLLIDEEGESNAFQ